MGKLHKLRRAILKNPNKFVSEWGRTSGAHTWKSLNGIREFRPWWGRSYRAFVKHVLDGVGNADSGGARGAAGDSAKPHG